MEEDVAAINASTRNERIKNFFITNKKKITFLLVSIILLALCYFAFDTINKKNKVKLSDNYNSLLTNYISGNKANIEKEMVKIIETKDKTYSPLALYFLLDNDLIDSKDKINNFFDILINETNLDNEITNLIIYKKALYNSDFETENNLIKILNPILNSDSIWKSEALYLLAEYFFSKNEKQKSKEFFEKILILENGNSDIQLEAQKRILRDFSE